MITSKMKKVYYSPMAGRNFMTLNGACNAESKRIVRNKYPITSAFIDFDHYDYDYGVKGYFEHRDHGSYLDDLILRFSRYIKYNFKRLEGER